MDVTQMHGAPRREQGGHPGRIAEVLTALSMTVGRGRAARLVADAAGLAADDRVVDIGCGPGTAVRQAARRCAGATGVDPSPAMLRLARRISTLRRARDVRWLEGSAEALPLPAAAVSVAWALSSVHHWSDRDAGVREIHRVLAPSGRVLLGERLVEPGAHGHGAHGLSREGADELAGLLTSAGFADVRTEVRSVGRRTLIFVCGRCAPARGADRAGA
jgi:SAM-dependent methyltransferase